MLLASFPSPSRSVWDLGPIPIRAYALCIIAGIVAAIWIGERRWVARGGRRGTVSDIAVWAVIFGLIGGRLYHVITDNELYFRAGRDPWRAFYVWEGGLGVWGAIALGGVGAWIGCRRRGIKLPPFADAVAPGIAVAQGLGRWGNYFNQELFGRPTDLPWGVRIDPDRPSTVPGATAYHPTFLYESLWDLALAGVLIYVDRRFRMGRGRVFALYVMGYTAGRVWIEMLRIDTANHVLGLRLNVWTSILVFAGGLVYFLLHRGPRETVVEPTPATDAPADGSTTGTAAEEATPADAEPAGDSTPPAEKPDEAKAAAAGTPAAEKPDRSKAAADGTPAAEKPEETKAAEGGTAAVEPQAARAADDGTPAEEEPEGAKAAAAGTPAAEKPEGSKAADDVAPPAAEPEAAEAAADGAAAEEPEEKAGRNAAAGEAAAGEAAAGEAAGGEAADETAVRGGAAVAAGAPADGAAGEETDTAVGESGATGGDGDGAGDGGGGEQRRRRLSPAGWRRR